MCPNSQNASNQAHRKPRWWPAIVILLVTSARCFQIWFLRESDTQFKLRGTADVLVVGAVLTLSWLMLFSRFAWKTRFRCLAVLAIITCALPLLFKVRGVTGDRLPILKWRWHGNSQVVRQIQPSLPRDPGNDGKLALLSPKESFPQYLGPTRDGIIQGSRLSADWKQRPPELIWRQPVGAGWAGISVQGHRLVTLEQYGEYEEVKAYDVRSGEQLWFHRYRARFEESAAGLGPRSVPAIATGRVYACGATGRLTCLDLATGHELWSRDLFKEHQAREPNWGFSCSPLVHADAVFVTPGGPGGHSVAAYDAVSGDLKWSSGDNRAGYSSPVLTEIGGQTQLLIFDHVGITGYAPGNGQLLWHFPIPTAPHVANPLRVQSDQVLVSCGSGVGTWLVSVRQPEPGRWESSLLWKTPRFKSKFSNLLLIDGFLYGLDDGRMACLEVATGDLRWKEARYGHGQLLLVEDRILVVTEEGDLALVAPASDGFKELARHPGLDFKTWNPPAFVGDRLLLRNEREMVCYRLPLEPENR